VALVVAHILQRFAIETGLAVYADEELVRARLKETVEKLSNEGLDTSLRIVNQVGPQPAHEIADVAPKAGADLIVVGSRGHGAIAGLLGSVVVRLLHVAPCPVVVVPTVAAPARSE
jgi:nucleotide-binding universal stress UspA family protein